MFPIQTSKSETVLLPYTSTWGWGTWKNKWAIFDYNMSQKDEIKNNQVLSNKFNISNYDFIPMLEAKDNSWGIRWYYSVFKRNGLGVFPTQSLIINVGFDGTGINKQKTENAINTLSLQPITLEQINTIDLQFYNQFLRYFTYKKTKNGSEKKIISKLINKLKRK
jgi:hypothetical protein